MQGMSAFDKSETNPFDEIVEEIIRKRFGDHDNGRGGDDAEIRGAWLVLGVFLSAVGLVSLALAVGIPGQTIKKSVQNIEKRFMELAKEISALIKDVNEILTLLKELPEIVRGIVDDAVFDTAMSRAGSISGDLSSYFVSEEAADEAYKKGILSRQVEKLGESIGVMLDFKGLSGVILATPYYVAWAQTFVYVERRKKKEAARRLVWEHPTHLHVMRTFKTLFAAVETQMEIYRPSIDTFPWPDKVYRKDGHRFEVTDIPMKSSYSRSDGVSPELYTVYKFDGVPQLLSTGHWNNYPFAPRPDIPAIGGPNARNKLYWYKTSWSVTQFPYPSQNPFADNLSRVQFSHWRFREVFLKYVEIDRFLSVFEEADMWSSFVEKYLEKIPLEWRRRGRPGIPDQEKSTDSGSRI